MFFGAKFLKTLTMNQINYILLAFLSLFLITGCGVKGPIIF